MWDFMAIFLPERDLTQLALLNILPREVSGIQHPVPLEGADGISEAGLRSEGFTIKDVVNFYYYVLISELISKVDTSAKRMNDIIGILSTDSKLRQDEQVSYLSGTPTALANLVSSNVNRLRGGKDVGFMHPVQDVVRQVGVKVLGILNIFNSSHIDFKKLISSGELSILNFSLEKKAVYGQTSSSDIFGDRRVLKKVFALLSKMKASNDGKTMSFTGQITGVTTN